MYKLLQQLFRVSLLFLILLILRVGAYRVPTAKFEIYEPRGFEVSIPDQPGVTLFAFHGNINDEIKYPEVGTVAGDVLKAENGRWTFRDNHTKLKPGTGVIYWTYVIFENEGYLQKYAEYEVRDYGNTTTDSCLPTKTVMNGGIPAECAGQIIFEEEFNGSFLNISKWQLERRFPTEPDYEFVMYTDTEPQVIKLWNGKVTVKPIPTLRVYGPKLQNLLTETNMGPRCTGRRDTEDCYRKPTTTSDIIPPYISAQFSTKTKFSFKYGRVEIRAELPCIEWAYPQLWLQPAHHKYGMKDYQSGQMRIAYSRVNSTGSQLYGGLIVNAKEPWRSARMCHAPTAADWCDAFHVFELTYHEDFVAVAVDGKEYCRWTYGAGFRDFEPPLPNKPALEWASALAPFDQEFYITLGYGIGGHNDFKDDYEKDKYEWTFVKPWTNLEPKAMKKYWKTMNAQFDDRRPNDALIIDYVRVYAV